MSNPAVLRPLLSFLLINGPKTALCEVDGWDDLFSCLVWSRVPWCRLYARVSIRVSFRFFRHLCEGHIVDFSWRYFSSICVVVVRFDTFVCTLIFEMNNVILSPKYNNFDSGVLCCQNFECSAVCPSRYLRASYHVYKIGCLLVHGISLPTAQLFVIAIENILQGGVWAI